MSRDSTCHVTTTQCSVHVALEHSQGVVQGGEAHGVVQKTCGTARDGVVKVEARDVMHVT